MSLSAAFRRIVLAALVSMYLAASFNALLAAGPLQSTVKPGYQAVQFFEAIERGEIAATVHVRDAEELNIAIENRTDRELAVVMPDVFAAVPVYAQFQPAAGNFFNQGNQAGNQGVSAPGGPFNFGNQQNGNQRNNPFNNAGIFNVPPGKVIKAKQPCVCLEHGKPDPNVRLDYEIRPMKSVLDDPQVARLVQLLVLGTDQRVVQLAVWHRANGIAWEQLAALKIDRLGRADSPQYTSAELESAQELLKQVSKMQVEEPNAASPGELSAQK